ncbi:MAG TPA: hypothetical protein VK043_04195 [Burkholderiales bacterium]|nr:hypothetical protein [Burkholderiales bacterium]
MATIAQRPYSGPERRSSYDRRRASAALARADGLRLSWGGIWGGVLVAVGTLLLLAALGVAVGITAANPGETEAATFGTGAGIWAGASLLVALFLGGLVSTRAGFITDRTTGFFEGVLVWVVSILLMAYLASTGLNMVASGAFRLIGGASQAVSTVIQGASGPNVNVSGSVEQMASQLRDPRTAQQIALATGLPAAEVQAALGETAQRVENAKDNPGQAAREARQGIAQLWQKATASGALEQKAEAIQPQASRAAWITFGALVLSLLAAVIGALAGRRRPVLGQA